MKLHFLISLRIEELVTDITATSNPFSLIIIKERLFGKNKYSEPL
jgi:hypothetical protein